MAKELFVYSPYKSKFEEQVSSGAVDDSQIGIIAESGELWVKGTYLPIVDLSNKADISKGVIEADGLKDRTDTTFFTPNIGLDPNTTLATQKYVTEATTNFAKDLTGVIEATAEEFTFRPSAGDKSIRDESAVIRKIKGNTIVTRYADNTSEVLPMRTIGIETIGFNQWDEQWELGTLTDFGAIAHNSAIISRNFNKILPSTTYYCAYLSDVGSIGNILQIGFWDMNMVYIGRQYVTNKAFTTPANAAYFKVATNTSANITTYNNDICINLSHSGVRNGEYEPYAKHVRQLPEIYKYFPEGMNGNANVWDEINAEKAIKRWGVVDLGSLTWIKGATGTSGVFRWLGKGIEHLVVKTKTDKDIPNIVCAKYILSSASNIWATTMPMQVSLDPTGSVLIYDSGYSYSSTTVATFTAHMQGVLLYYELAEPRETPITEAMQLDYEVEDFGTEKALSLASSAPFRADIVYQFNAEGRIRDNSRNIERVESNIQNVERTITTSLIPSQTAMLGLPNKVMTWNGRSTMMSLPIAESIDGWELEESPYGVLPTGKQVKDYISSITNRLIPSQTAFLGLPNKVMVWDGYKTLMSLPIADGLEDWGNADSTHGYLVTDQQVKKYIADVESSITDKLIPSSSATLESSNRVMVWNGDYAMTSLPIAANFAEWAEGAIPTGKQVMDYISAIKGSLSIGLIPKETLEIGANGVHYISPNKTYEITTASSTEYNIGLEIVTTSGVDVVADNEWRIRIDARRGFRGSITIEPLTSGYSISWAYPEDVNLGAGTAPTIKANFIYDIQFRMIGKTLIGSYKKYR